MRDRSPVETILRYATFLALSLAVHVVVILGDRPSDRLRTLGEVREGRGARAGAPAQAPGARRTP